MELKPKKAAYHLVGAQDIENWVPQPVFFSGLAPIVFLEGIKEFIESDQYRLLKKFHARTRGRRKSLVVIRPYRPVPRPLYVLDDPSLVEEDRSLISFLVKLWNDETTRAERTRDTILSNLADLRLASHLEVRRPMRTASVVEIRVATGQKRHLVTIADVGFGLSQILPLVARDSTLRKGVLVSYQPEVHLHPFAQSRLADLFVRSTNRGNSLFVETHSHYLILRLQYLIATGEIDPNRLRVFCVEHQHGRSTVRVMRFAADGTPNEPWPVGFLDTSLTLARELAQQRLPAH